MEISVIETQYPLDFRKTDALDLGRKLKHRHSINLVGMRRVGIRNFLRFFLYHRDIVKTYIGEDKQLFVPIDMNDLTEREMFPFWSLTLKRIVDAVEHSNYPPALKDSIESLFLDAIQSRDLFLLIDNVRQSLITIVREGISPTLFFIRFDRMKDRVPPSFFDNLAGLSDATDGKLAYVFTSFRSFDELFLNARAALPFLSKSIYLKPASHSDMKIIYNAHKKRYQLNLSTELEEALFEFSGGNYQYLQMILVIINEQHDSIRSKEDLFKILIEDERIALHSEELWESLTPDEQKVLVKIINGEEVSQEDKDTAAYLWNTGFFQKDNKRDSIFTPLFLSYLKNKREGKRKNNAIHLTKKEHLLYTFLETHVNEICEREDIIEKVWPEYQEFGVSDWAIDRLVARIRVKLREQNSNYEIITVRTRGYKLSAKKE